MRLAKPLLQLPIRFDAELLAAEVNALPASAWMPHPHGYVGNEAVPLVSVGGEMNDAIAGSMAPTEHLERCPYIQSVMAELGGAWGRSRLMGLASGSQVKPHVDINYYWRTHLRIHIPVVTNPGVCFNCGGESVHMAAGECWVFDSFAWHDVQNEGSERRVHLVLDTVGSERLWDLIEQASHSSKRPPEPWRRGHNASPPRPLAFEQLNLPAVMSPWEIRQHLEFILEGAPSHPLLDPVTRRLDRFVVAWHSAWARFGTSDSGLTEYQAIIDGIRGDLRAMNAHQILLRNKVKLDTALEALIFRVALAPSTAVPTRAASAAA
jgi:hypothetical protein